MDLRTLMSRCLGFVLGKRMDSDLDDELRSHIDFAVEENLGRGMPEAEARREALRAFGGVSQTREEFRMQRGLPFVEVLAQDVRYALRQLRKSPGFAITVVVTLALGIGANTAIFTLVQGILLRSLPVNDPGKLYRIGDKDDCCYYDSFENDNGDFDLFSYDLYRHLSRRRRSSSNWPRSKRAAAATACATDRSRPNLCTPNTFRETTLRCSGSHPVRGDCWWTATTHSARRRRWF